MTGHPGNHRLGQHQVCKRAALQRWLCNQCCAAALFRANVILVGPELVSASTEEERDEEEGAGVNAPLLLRIADDDGGSVGSDDTSDWGDRSDAGHEAPAGEAELRREPLGGGEYTSEDPAAPAQEQTSVGSQAAAAATAAAGGQESTGGPARSQQQQEPHGPLSSRQPAAAESELGPAGSVGEIEVWGSTELNAFV